jgi:vancomycin permeability regulator SanA
MIAFLKKYNRKFKLPFILFLTWFLGHSLFITIDGLIDDKKSADVAVILGSKVNEDGTLSERLEKRLDCGLQLYKNDRVKTIIVSGGFGKEGFYEGDKMKAFLVKKGVPKDLIIVDNFGDNTIATVENTIQLKKKFNFESIIIVSQYFHITRTKMLFKKKGFKIIRSASPNYFEIRDFYSILREFAAYYTELI